MPLDAAKNYGTDYDDELLKIVLKFLHRKTEVCSIFISQIKAEAGTTHKRGMYHDISSHIAALCVFTVWLGKEVCFLFGISERNI